MPTLYNVDHQPAIFDHEQAAVMPGESHEFTTAEVKAGLVGSWSEVDPRRGLEDETSFKKRRDAKVADTPDPAVPGEEKE